MQLLVSYFLLGLSLAAPMGPINAAQIERGIRGGFMHSWLIGLGALLADGVFMLLVYFGVIHFLSSPFMQTLLWLFGFFVLSYIGCESLLKAGKVAVSSKRSSESLLKSFNAGFFMSLSNPLSILFWLGVFGSVLANMIVQFRAHEVLLYSSIMMMGIVVWDLFMAIVSSLFRRFLSSRFLTAVSVVSGLSLIGFGVYFGFEAYRALFL